MFQENRRRAVALATARIERVLDVLRRLAHHDASIPCGPLIREAALLYLQLEEDLHRLHGYGEETADLSKQALWAKARIEEALDEGLDCKLRPGASERLRDQAAFLERWRSNRE